MKPLRLVGLGVALFLIAVGAAWLYPADSYLLLPDDSHPLAPLVKVEGEKPHPPGGISYVDVIVRQASVLEELVPFTRPDGADLVPEQAIVPPGSNYAEAPPPEPSTDGPLAEDRRRGRAPRARLRRRGQAGGSARSSTWRPTHPPTARSRQPR